MSGIYFPGASMPLSCAPCKYRGWCAVWKENELPAHIRSKNCPLVEVPDHGRLINADALKEIEFCGLQTDKKIIYQMGWNDAIEAIAKNAPTVIPASEEGE